MAIREEAVITDLDEAARQHMQQKAPQELDRIESHRLDTVVLLRVAPAEAQAALLERPQPSVLAGDTGRHEVIAARYLQRNPDLLLSSVMKDLSEDRHVSFVTERPESPRTEVGLQNFGRIGHGLVTQTGDKRRNFVMFVAFGRGC